MKYAFVIAGTHSGVGKTTATLTLLATLHDKAMLVQPFKVGPDYLDPGYHNLFSGGKKSRNLDSFLLSEEYIRDSFARNTRAADVAIVEGVMGMYDGKEGCSRSGSTVETAKILGLPIILVVDAHSMAQSAAACVLGFKQFDPTANLRGVIFNRVGGPKHYEYLKRAIRPEWGIEPLGYIPHDAQIHIPERHLGLTSALENRLEHSFFDKLKRASDRLEIDRLLELAVREESASPLPELPKRDPSKKRVRIGIAYDEAFSFYYEDNFDLLRAEGADLVFFSPLYGHVLPEDLDALYLGGGFPEMFAPKLSHNLSMMEAIQKFARDGKFIYAECGGLIYLAEKFTDREGRPHHMVGLVPGEVKMTTSLQSFGYKEITTEEETFLFPKGMSLRSHEFHYSRWTSEGNVFRQPYAIQKGKDGFWEPPVLASYQHLHFGTHPDLASRFVNSILDFKNAGAPSL